MKVFAMASVLGGACATYPDDVLQKYLEWQTTYGGNGNDSELDNFAANLVRIEELRRSERGTATYDHMTPFANLSPEQFSVYKGFASPPADTAVVEVVASSDPREDFDWRDAGAVNPIKDQKQCGSCWAFSVVANIEGAGFLDTGKLVSLSEQQLVDCSKSTGDQGCNGGLPENTFQMMINENMGLELESDYPYTARDGVCKVSSSSEVAFITAWQKFSRDEDEIAAGLQEYGPLSIGINANTMQTYSGGVADPSPVLCSPLALDHGVAIVGFGTDGSTAYWTIRNSWGLTWGEQGYYRIVRGKGACGLNTDVTTATGVSIDGPAPGPSPTPSPTPPSPSPAGGHYEAPPCSADELQGDVVDASGATVGSACCPPCEGSSCPSDVPEGAAAVPECVLQDTTTGAEYCGLTCYQDDACPSSATCAFIGGLFGICVYPPITNGGHKLNVRPSDEVTV